MSETIQQPDFWRELKDELSQLGRNLADEWTSFAVKLRNQIRAWRGAQFDYVIIPLEGSLPERAQPPRSFIQRQFPLPPLPLSMETLTEQIQAVADAANVKGVVFVFRGLEAGLSTLQNFRSVVQRLRQAGKETVVFTPYLDLAHYYAATAADRIVVPVGTQFNVLGLRFEVQFFKDALAQAGIQAEMIRVSPYKTAGDQFSEAAITPEHRAQLEWLLDDQFDLITQGMADGRRKSQDDMKALINQAPFSAAEALKLGLIDHIGYEDELSYLLVDEQKEENETRETAVSPAHTTKRPQATLQSWDEAAHLLMEKPRRRTHKFIGIISLEGNIVMGPSRHPPVDLPLPFISGSMAGEQTLVRLLRKTETIDNMAALILYVDSPGGSALASDLIGRQIQRLAHKKPVLVYMGNTAASGGYYVSAYGQHIMCQPGTITGSIGVISGRISLQGLYEKLRVHQVNLDRGERIGLYRNTTPLTDEERQLFRDGIMETYEQFKQVVANGRRLPYEDLDPICNGRVWTGRQALAHNLVDSHGDFHDAIRKAAALADLPIDDQHTISVVNLYPKNDDYTLPQPFSTDTLTQLSNWLLHGPWQQMNGQPLLLMPLHIRLQ